MMAFSWFCLAGIFAALVFDILRVFRRNVRHCAAVVMAEDILWCSVCFCTAFFCVVRCAGGVVRWFFLAGFFASMLLWFLLVSPWLLRFIQAAIRLIAAVLRRIVHPFWLLAKKAASVCRFGKLFEKLFSKNSKNPIAKSEQTIV